MSYENRTLPCVGKNLTPFKLSHRTLRCVGKNLTHMNTRDVQRLDVSVFLFGGQHATTISRCFCFYFSFAPDRSIARRLSHPSNPLPFSFKMPRRFLPRDIRLHLAPSLLCCGYNGVVCTRQRCCRARVVQARPLPCTG